MSQKTELLGISIQRLSSEAPTISETIRKDICSYKQVLSASVNPDGCD